MSGPGSSQKADHSWKTREALSSIPAPKNLTKTAARLMKECWWLSVKTLPAVQETRVQFPGHEDSLEEEMTTLSSILAWEITWTEEPGGLQSTGSEGVRQD